MQLRVCNYFKWVFLGGQRTKGIAEMLGGAGSDFWICQYVERGRCDCVAASWCKKTTLYIRFEIEILFFFLSLLRPYTFRIKKTFTTPPPPPLLYLCRRFARVKIIWQKEKNPFRLKGKKRIPWNNNKNNNLKRESWIIKIRFSLRR